MRTFARKTLGVAVLLALSSAASGADLLEIFKQARDSDPTYSAARASWAASQERIPQARAALLPLASVSASTRYTDRSTRFRDDTTPRTSGDFGSGDVSLSVTQPIYRRQNTIAYDQALTQVEQADAQLALAAQDLILRVAQAYFDVLLAGDNVTLAEAQKAAIGQQLELARRNFEVGVATITDTHEAQARYDLTVAQEIAARNDLELRQRALEQLIGRGAPPLAPLASRFPLNPPQPARMDQWVELAQRANLQVRIAQSATTFAEQEIARNRAAHMPTLDAFATLSGSTAGAATTSTPGNDNRSSVVGVQLSIPIYQGGAISSRVREAIAVQSRTRDELEAARRTAQFNARQAYLGVTTGITQVQALEAALTSTQSQLESTRLGRDVGVRTQIDVLNAQQLLYSAARDLAQSKYNYLLSLLRLEAAIGELTEDDLGAVNRWLDREAAGLPDRSTAAAVAAQAAKAADAVQVKPLAPPKGKPQPQPEPQPAVRDESGEVLQVVEGWAKAWRGNAVDDYLAHYAPGFKPARGATRSAWEAERRARVAAPRRIELAIEKPQVVLSAPDRATVSFRQQYRSGPLDVTTHKTLVLVKQDGRWLIDEERIRSETINAPAAPTRRLSVTNGASAEGR